MEDSLLDDDDSFELYTTKSVTANFKAHFKVVKSADKQENIVKSDKLTKKETIPVKEIIPVKTDIIEIIDDISDDGKCYADKKEENNESVSCVSEIATKRRAGNKNNKAPIQSKVNSSKTSSSNSSGPRRKSKRNIPTNFNGSDKSETAIVEILDDSSGEVDNNSAKCDENIDCVDIPIEGASQKKRRSARIKNQKAPLYNVNASNTSVPKKNNLKKKTPTNNIKATTKKKSASDSSFMEEQRTIPVLEEEDLSENVNHEVTVKVIWKSFTVKKFPIRKFQKLTSIFEYFMKEENLSKDKIILTLNNVKVSSTDTPDSLNLQICDFIDGGVITDKVTFQTSQTKKQDSTNSITLKFQDSNKKVIPLTLQKDETIKIAMLKYAEQVDTEFGKIKFILDGDLINPGDTPTTLGLESGDVVDVKILS